MKMDIGEKRGLDNYLEEKGDDFLKSYYSRKKKELPEDDYYNDLSGFLQFSSKNLRKETREKELEMMKNMDVNERDNYIKAKEQDRKKRTA